jgi:hypothetical protein
MLFTDDQTKPYHGAPASNETISKQSRGLSVQRDGRETFRVAFSHDRVEQSSSAIFQLMTSVVLIEPRMPRMLQSPLESARQRQDGWHAQSMPHAHEKNIGRSSQKM